MSYRRHMNDSLFYDPMTGEVESDNDVDMKLEMRNTEIVFLADFNDTLTHAIHSANNESRIMDLMEVFRVKNVMIKFAHDWTFEHVTKRARQWEKNKRFMSALSTGLSYEAVNITTADDLLLLHYSLVSGLQRMPQAFEYYAKNGDLIELMRVLSEKHSDVLDGHDAHSMTATVAQNIRALVYRAYCYDVLKIESDATNGDDPRVYMSLPLEVRLSFAGIDDPLTEPDLITDDQYLYNIDHAHSISDSAFSFGEHTFDNVNNGSV